MKIAKVVGREIFDSRGIPTLECELWLDSGIAVRSSVPSGTSRGSFEAIELRDGGARLGGKGVSKAIDKLENVIAPMLLDKEPEIVEMDMAMIDLDGTENKSNLGANTMLAASIAILRAQAAVNEIEAYEFIAHLCNQTSVSIPFPMFNILNGGLHGDNNLQMQEIMIVPTGAQSFRESFEIATMIFHNLRTILIKNGLAAGVGYEGGFVPHVTDVHQALDLVMQAIQASKASGHIQLALDIAANQLYDPTLSKYNWQGKALTSSQMIEYYAQLAKEYPLYSIEDGLAESDWEGWQELNKALSDNVQIVGDDLFVTNPYRIAQAIEDDVATAAIIKPNQIGTITETLQSINLCKENGMQTIVSHRSGETEDTFIVDLAVGTSAGHIKAGAPSRGERIAKYNQLLRIEDTLMLSLLE